MTNLELQKELRRYPNWKVEVQTNDHAQAFDSFIFGNRREPSGEMVLVVHAGWSVTALSQR